MNSETFLEPKDKFLKCLFKIIVKTHYLFLKIVLRQVFHGPLASEYNSTYDSYIDMKVDPTDPFTFSPQVLTELWVQR